MQELEQKLNELETARSCCRRCNKELEKETDSLKQEKILRKNIEELREINRKIYIINEAMNILEGIGGE